MTTKVKPEDCVAGKWYHREGWGRVLACGTTGGDKIPAFAVRAALTTEMRYFHDGFLAPLPDCTGWDWQPLVIREGGYYELANGHIVGPLRSAVDGRWTNGNGLWWEPDGKHTKREDKLSIAREFEPRKPKYRPFRNCWEFLDHAKRPMVLNDEVVSLGTIEFDDVDVFLHVGEHRMGGKWFTLDALLACKFSDTGEPCGVRE